MKNPEPVKQAESGAAGDRPSVILASLVPKDGKQTSSFKALIATIVVGALFTSVFSWATRKGYMTSTQAGTIRDYLVQTVSDLLPYVYLAVVGVLTRAYIRVRGDVSVAKVQELGRIIAARETASASPTSSAGAGGVAVTVTPPAPQPQKEGESS